jgi:general secretion pathway protein G
MRRQRGFTILEVLIVVAIIGIIAAIAIWNYYTSIQRARQKRTMADIRSIATAWEARASDVKFYNAASQAFTMPGATLTFNEMNTLLAPTYIKVLPRIDGWSVPFGFAADQPIGGSGANEYVIRSAGRDRVFSSSYTVGGTTDFDCDIVFSAGSFIVYPEGLQR